MEQTKNKRVLVAVPYHEKKRYCLDQLYTSLAHVSKHAQESGFSVEVVVRHDLRPFGQKDNVKIQREFFRKMAVDGWFDLLFFHGADTIPPVDVIQRLDSHHASVVSGVYWQRGEEKAMNAIAWLDDEEGNPADPKLKNKALQFPHGSDGSDEIMKAAGFGLDCVLIGRRVFDQVSWLDWEVNDDDYPFCDAVKDLDIPLFIDNKVQCKHWDTGATYSFNGGYIVI